MSEARPPAPSIRVLHLEDDPVDHVLVQELLAADGLQCEYVLAKDQREFETVVRSGAFDVIISDYSLPSYDGTQALALARQWQKNVPFIFFSGTIGEDTAVESLKTGATDYVVKQRPRRLVAAVRRALQEAAERNRHAQAQEKIREQAALLDKAQDAIIVCDLDDRIIFWNHGAERVYGWNSDAALGRRVTDLFSEELSAPFEAASKSLLALGEWQGELMEKTKSGRQVTVQSRWTLVRDDAGQPKSKLIIGTDVTEQKNLEEKFLRTQRLESLGILVSGIAHDLNNALAPVLMGVGILEKAPLPSDVVEIVQTMKASSLRGSQMVQQILAFARGSGGQKTVLHVNLLLREMGKIITDTFPKSIVCRIKASPEAWPVSGQAIQLHQVIMNLCINARDAMPKGGTLVLATENIVVSAAQAAPHGAQPGSYLCLSVRDTGTGIPDAQMPQIFQPFFTTKAPGHGTGLGLSTCQMIVKNHGGFLTVESRVGRGTEFKVFFPAREGTVEDAKLPPGIPLPVGHGETILVVDDEAAILALAQSTLETYGYRVHTAASGPEAIVIFGREHQNIRVVIMDKSMPFMNGAATISALRRIKPELRLISASGHNLHKGTDTQRAIKADALIEKPFTIERLLFTISEVLAKG